MLLSELVPLASNKQEKMTLECDNVCVSDKAVAKLLHNAHTKVEKHPEQAKLALKDKTGQSFTWETDCQRKNQRRES